MGQEPQIFDAPDGTKMVVLPQADYQRLLLLAEDNNDFLSATDQMRRIQEGEGTMPAEVLDYILDEGLHPIAGWRKFRGMTQSVLAKAAGCSQVWLSRIEAGAGHGTPKTRRALAYALDAPTWALEESDNKNHSARPISSAGHNIGRKYIPLRDFLTLKTTEKVTLNFDDIAKLVGGLPSSASLHREWWANHAGNSQATGWLNADYFVEEVDQRRKVVTFSRCKDL